MKTALIIDDEKKVRETITHLLKLYCPKITDIYTAADITEAKAIIYTHSPHLVFLDVNLKEQSGFELLEQLKNYSFKLIFITAYNEYAVKAFKCSAVDYLLKPLHPDELTKAVDKALQLINQEAISTKIESLLTNLDNKHKTFKKLVLKTVDNLYVVNTNDILYLTSDGPYTTFFLSNKTKIVVSTHLKEYEEMLAELHFFRPHQSHLVNVNCIERFDKKDGGIIVMNDQSRIPVSTRKKERLIQLLDHINEY
jgi:two-component system, LytTR family, response regulator